MTPWAKCNAESALIGSSPHHSVAQEQAPTSACNWRGSEYPEPRLSGRTWPPSQKHLPPRTRCTKLTTPEETEQPPRRILRGDDRLVRTDIPKICRDQRHILRADRRGGNRATGAYALGALQGLRRSTHLPPVHAPERILDCGCGACDWAVDVAEHFPDSEVLGIDISPHMIPEDLPNNLEIQIDDLNGRFTFPTDHFDVVHSRLMASGIHANRWRSYVQDIFRVLKPGGWCQMVEIYFNAQSDNGTLERGQ
ncbi:hypothetical protein ACCO45_002459 [Purpureocillium lilacinum]|uniref:Uncharacterized protein n=1 Tax=Purpureocillium lilacinum TaxID=33203 RepID=A0ACC4E9Z2_PURLI